MLRPSALAMLVILLCGCVASAPAATPTRSPIPITAMPIPSPTIITSPTGTWTLTTSPTPEPSPIPTVAHVEFNGMVPDTNQFPLKTEDEVQKMITYANSQEMLNHSANPVTLSYGASGTESIMYLRCNFSNKNCAVVESFKQEVANGTSYQLLLKVLTLDDSGQKVEKTLKLYIGGADIIFHPDWIAKKLAAIINEDGEQFILFVYKVAPIASDYYKNVPIDFTAIEPRMVAWQRTKQMPGDLPDYTIVAFEPKQ